MTEFEKFKKTMYKTNAELTKKVTLLEENDRLTLENRIPQEGKYENPKPVLRLLAPHQKAKAPETRPARDRRQDTPASACRPLWSAACRAAVPELTATAYLDPVKDAAAFSKS